jgi:diacylglycerol kinase family enzyme
MEIRLTDLNLNGKILRLSGIKNIKKAIENEIRLGAKTIVAVGNNQTVNKIIGAIISADVYAEFQRKTLLGIIPIGDDNSIATSFGIKNEEMACNIILARRIEKIDLGIVNNYYFLNHAQIQSQKSIVKIKNYHLEPQKKGEIKIINLLSDKDEKKDTLKSSPHDGLLDVIIKGGRKDITFINTKNLIIENSDHKLLIDNVLEVETPVEIGVLKNAINVIVGKDRIFN